MRSDCPTHLTTPLLIRLTLAAFVLAVLLGIPTSSSLAQPPPKKLVKECTKGDAKQCYWVGINQSARDAAESRRYFALACDGGYRKGCGELYDASKELMDGSAEDQSEAIRHFEVACAKDYGRSCSALASALWQGTGVAADQARASSLWRKGCDLGSRVGCRRTGSAFEKGTLVSKDLSRALAFYQKSCELELESACADAGRLLLAGVSPSSTVGGEASRGAAETGAVQALGPLRKACLAAHMDKTRGDACLSLGRLLAEGNGVAQDLALAYEAFDKGCRDSHAGSCFEAGRAAEEGRGREQDDNAATNFFGKACRLKSMEGCRELCRIQCDAGQPYACERLEKKKWPREASCAMPRLKSNH